MVAKIKEKFYNGIKNLRDVKTVVKLPKNYAEEMEKIRNDICYFAENYFYIVNVDYGKIKIKLHPFQKEMLQALIENPRTVFNCSRQIGKTTIVKIFIIWYILTNVDKSVGVASYIEKSSIKILTEMKMSYCELPIWMQFSVIEWNVKSITLSNGCRIMTSATTGNTFRGEAISLLYVDETAIIPNDKWKEFEDSVLPTISSATTSRIIYTSTPKGFNHFFSICEDARTKRSKFYYFQAEWWKVPHYTKQWAEARKNEITGFNKDQLFAQNYECAFISEDSEFISQDLIREMVHITPKHTERNLLFYKPYEEGHNYIVGVDVATGKGKDASAIVVLDITKYPFEVVCVFMDDKIESLDLAVKIKILSTKYHCTSIIERNTYGQGVIDMLKHVLDFYDMEKIDGETGLYTSGKSKNQMVTTLKTFIELKKIILNDSELIFQISKFARKSNGTYSALTNFHDDLVMALMMALYVVHLSEFEGEDFYKMKIKESYDEESFNLIISDIDGEVESFGFKEYSEDEMIQRYYSERKDDFDIF